MKDKFDRKINYLRISITDLCNLKCTYCVGDKVIEKKCHENIISPERIRDIVSSAVKLGINKVRITGGEPLVRKGVIEICRYIRDIPGINELCLTTNGVLLERFAQELFDAGVSKLNISLDTLSPEKYHRITRVGDINDVLRGIKKAQEVGFKDIKINAVLIGGFNDDEIKDFADFAIKNNLTVRFIELMPIGESKKMDQDSFISNNVILKALPNLKFEKNDGVSILYTLNDQGAKIGLISPLSNIFCKDCSRLRLTSDGKLRPCLHSPLEIDTTGLEGEELLDVIKKAILLKPEKHHLENGSDATLGMNEIGG